MTKPMIAVWDCETSVETIRQMTDEEYGALVASGWTPTEEPTLEEETPTE